MAASIGLAATSCAKPRHRLGQPGSAGHFVRRAGVEPASSWVISKGWPTPRYSLASRANRSAQVEHGAPRSLRSGPGHWATPRYCSWAWTTARGRGGRRGFRLPRSRPATWRRYDASAELHRQLGTSDVACSCRPRTNGYRWVWVIASSLGINRAGLALRSRGQTKSAPCRPRRQGLMIAQCGNNY